MSYAQRIPMFDMPNETGYAPAVVVYSRGVAVETKPCVSCKEAKPLDQFYFRKDNGKLTGECRACKQARSAVYFEANKERHQALLAERYRNFRRFARYGITKDQYESLLALQGDCCALCGSSEPGGKGIWHIDHGHQEGDPDPRKSFRVCDAKSVRGLLCHQCNVTIGAYETLIRRVGEDQVLDYLTRPVVLPEALPPVQKIGKNDGACSIEGCTASAKAMGMCASHYRRQKLYGNAEAEFKPHEEYQARGASHGLAKLNEAAVRDIRTSADKGVVLARKYGVSPQVISHVRSYRTWTHVE